MIKWFKKHFIPHHTNDYRPHVLRRSATRMLLVAILGVELLVFFAPRIALFTDSDFLASVLPSVLSELTNEKRAEAQLAQLTVNPLLEQAAQLKAEDMAANEYFAHTSPEGKTPWHWLQLVGYEFDYAGENLAINFNDSKDVTEAWMDSPTHKANIVKSAYTEVGTGIATGTFEGKETVYVAQVYANPRIAMAEDLTLIAQAPVVEVEETTVAVEEPAEAPAAVAQAPEPEVVPEQVLGAEAEQPTVSNPGPNFIEKAAASPRHTANAILITLASVITAALLLNLVIKIRVQHVDLVANGLLIVTVVFGFYLFNGFISPKESLEVQQIDYSADMVQS